VQKYEIPTIFISQKTILQTNYTKNIFIGFTNNESDEFVFIIIPAFKAESVPGFKVVEKEDGGIVVSIKKLNEECLDKIRDAIENKMGIKEYLERFTKPKSTVYQKKKPLLIEEDSENDEIDKNDKNDKIEKKANARKVKEQESSPISIEAIIEPSKNTTKKTKKVVLKGRKQTKKNVKPLLIIENSSPET
jgi:hypothetical protein